jgi:rare lipoprotein A
MASTWRKVILCCLMTEIGLGLWGCTSSPKFRRDEVSKPSIKWEQTKEPYQVGEASYYGPKFHGRPTTSGEIFNMHAMTAAHKILPLGSVVQVTHLENNRSVIVRINDRGPFVGDRIIDLSFGAAQELLMVEEGVARVRIDVLRFGEE